MVAVPLVALTLLVTVETRRHVQQQTAMAALTDTINVIDELDDLIRQLQRERGRSALYLSSGDPEFLPGLLDQRTETDAVLAAFRSALERSEAIHTGVAPSLTDGDLLEDLNALEEVRGRVAALAISPEESFAFYSDLVAHLQNSADAAMVAPYPDRRLAELLVGYRHLSIAIEAAGRERAMVGSMLVTGAPSRGEIAALAVLAREQEVRLASVRDRIPPDLAEAYAPTLDAVESGPVAEIRRAVIDGDLSADPVAWFDAATERIDGLYQVSRAMLTEARQGTVDLVTEARAETLRSGALGLAILLASLVATAAVGRRLSRRIGDLAEVTTAIDAGDLDRRAETRGGDELARLAESFNRMADDLIALNRTLEEQVEARTADLRASEARSRAMIEALPDLVFLLSPDDVYLEFVVPRADEAFPPPERFLGRHLSEALPPALADEFASRVRRARRSGGVEHFEYVFPMADALRHREARVVAIPGTGETVAIVRDITDLKTTERRLQGLVRSKDEFLASISHEIRTPLTAVLGCAELLTEAAAAFSETERRELATMIAGEAATMAHIVEDLLVVASLDLEDLRVQRTPVSLRAVVLQVLERNWGASEVAVVTGDDAVAAIGDPQRVRQILRNLLANAVHHGGEHIEVRIAQREPMAVVEVCDDGLGIAPENRESIFEPYVRLGTPSGRPGSLGLGLAVSRALARRMGGDLTYRYEAGTSVFELLLPIAVDTAPTALPALRPCRRVDHDSPTA